MNFHLLYTDFWEILAGYLDYDDIYSFALTCKQAYRACCRRSVQNKISYPMLYPYKLTYDQRSTIKAMETSDIEKFKRFKLIHGEVGAGKTISSIAYAIRNYSDDDSKVVMCGPPNLIKMWWTTLQKYFGIEPAVFHGINPKYSRQSWLTKPTEKFILISYKLITSHYPSCREWFDSTRDMLIIDEAHHQVSIDHRGYKEIMGLSATTVTKSGLSRGIKYILNSFDLSFEECTFSLDKDVIAKKLPAVVYHPYLMNVSETVRNACKNLINYTRKGEQDMSSIDDIARLLSHQIILDLKEYFTAGFIMIGRKRFRVEEGSGYYTFRNTLDHLPVREQNKLMEENANYDINKFAPTYNKYLQALTIIKWANKRGEKVILFDQSTQYLPFLHKFLIDNKVNSYIFSTHYDVAGRQLQLTKFKESETPGVLLSSVIMLGEGQNVTEANHVIFFTQCSEAAKYYQGVGRCWRFPQKKEVHVHLLFNGLFDQKIYEYACDPENRDIRQYDWVKLLDNKLE